MKNRVRGAAWILVCGGLVACSDDPPTVGTPSASAPAPPATVAPEAADYVAAVSIGEAVASLDVSFRIPERPVPGQPGEVILAVVSTVNLERLEVSITSTGLAIHTDPGSLVLTSVAAGERHELPVKFTAQEAGVVDLAVAVQLQSLTDSSEARFAVPILAQAVAPGG